MKRRIHIKSVPNNITALVKAAGAEDAANSLGITPNAIKKYIRFKVAPKSTEIAAGALLGGTQDNVTAVVQCDSETLNVIKRLIESSHGNMTVIKI